MIITNRYGLKIVAEYEQRSEKTAIVVHGHSGNRKQIHIQRMIKVLLEHNYSVISYDATNSIGESEGKEIDSCITKHYQDLEDVIKHFNLNSVLIAGHSLGAMAGLLYASNYPETVTGIAAFSSPVAGKLQFDYMEKLKPGVMEYWKKNGSLQYESSSRPGTMKTTSWSYMEDYLKYDLRDLAEKIICHVLLSAGTKDGTVNHKDSIELSKLIKNCELQLITDAPHTFLSEDELNQMESVLTTWLNTHAQ